MEYQPNAFKATFMLPIEDNQGKPFPAEKWGWWLDQTTKMLKGFTEVGTVRGFWRGQSEGNRMFSIVVKDENNLDELHELLQKARGVFQQKAIYFDCHAVYFEEVQ